MPLFFQQQVNADTRLAIWKIEEDESFFNAVILLQRNITHPHKRLQHLAGRYLLTQLFPQFPLALIQIADTRKPFLENELFHFSISHCGDFAAAIVSAKNRVGVDIELISDKIQRVQHKFVSDEEKNVVRDAWLVENANELLTLVWSCKEAVFKWYGLGNMDFKGHMQVQNIQAGKNKLFQTTILLKKEDRLLGLQSQFFDDVCLSYLVT